MRTSRILAGLMAGMATLLSRPALAQSTSLGEITQAAQRSGDKSREALVSIYGNVVNNPLATGGAGGSDTILAEIFQVANGALLVVGAFFACYVMFKRCRRRRTMVPCSTARNTRCGGPSGSCGALPRSFRPRTVGHSRSC